MAAKFSVLFLLCLAGVVAGATLPATVPTLYLCSDSTAASFGTQKQPLQGFGYFLGDYLTTNYVNRARSGRSTRSFINQGLWAELLALVKTGDYVVIEMGHNDNGVPGSGGDVGQDRSTLSGIGDKTVVVTNSSGVEEVVRSFGSYLKQMTSDVKDRGGIPVLSGMVPRMVWENKTTLQTTLANTEYARQVAALENVLFLDHTKYSVKRFQELGFTASKAMFPKDNTHTNSQGALVNAEAFATAVECADGIGSAALRQYLSQKANYLRYQC